MARFEGDYVKEPYEILRQKEIEYQRLRREVEALRIAAPLLDPEGPAGADVAATETLDEMITRERSLAEHASPPEITDQQASGEDAPTDTSSDNERKGPLSDSQTNTSWWRRLQSGT
jgi:hypothetical protein